MNKKVISKTIITSLLVLTFLTPWKAWSQSYLGLDGGFEGSATLDNTNTYSAPQASKWTKANASQTITDETSLVRSGSHSLKVSNTSSTGRRVWSPLMTVSSQTTQVTIQYFRRVTDASTNYQSNQEGTYRSGTENLQGTYDTPTVNAWDKQTYSPTSSTFTNIAGVIMHRLAGGTGGDMYIDDVCVYAGAVDNTAPNSPGTLTVNNATISSLDVSWSAASGGVDNGGYLVIRYSSSPNTDNDPNQNGIYATNNTTNNGTGGLTGTIRYNGIGTSFTDNEGLSSNTQYWYKVYTYDKAYNYSAESSGTGSTSSAATPTITVISLTAFGNQAVNTTSSVKSYTVSGSNLTADITITPPAGFEISKTSGSGFVANPSTLTLTQSGGTVSSTTIYAVFKPTAVTAYSGNISHVSSGATTQNVAVSGTGTSPSNPATFTATSGGSSQINLSATANANGNNIVVVWDGDGTFTTPTDGVAPGNAGDAFAGGTIHYKGAAASLTNHTGLNSNTAYYYKAFSYDALNYYSGGSTANATTSKVEPTNHPSGFSATVATPSYSAITVTWTDATGTTLPDAYLIKGSPVSYGSISAPVDGTAEADGGLVKNISQGTQTHTFTGLNGSTTYYFKIYPYTNSSTLIDYKTDGTIQQASATTTEAPSYAVGDFGFTAASGNWGTTNTNWKQWDGTGWNTTPTGAPTATDNVYILSGKTCIVDNSPRICKNLNIEVSSKLYCNISNMGASLRYVNVYGNINNEGTIGNGTGNDDIISFNIIGGQTSMISGSGSFTATRLRRNDGSGILDLNVNTNIELRYNGLALYNATNSPSSSQAFNVTIAEGKHLNLTGNGGTPAAGYELKSVDKAIIYGKLTITGTLTNAAPNTGITIKSTASGTGSLIHNTANVKGTVERYITAWDQVGGQAGFHFLSSPMLTETIRPGFVPNSNTPGSILQDFYKWDESAGTWINTLKSDGSWNSDQFESNFVQGRGYMVAYAANTTKTFQDTLNVAGVNVTGLTNTSGQAGAGWHLLGNPFPCAIKWTQGTWNRSAGIGNYAQTWNSAGGSYKVLSGAGIIPAMNGFMVYTSTAGGSLTIPADARLHADSAWYKSADPEQIILVAKDLKNGLYQESVLEFKEGAKPEFDLTEDCYFITGYAPVFCSRAGQTRLALNALPVSASNQQVPLYFVKNDASDFEITLQQTISGSRIMLTDLKLNQTINLSTEKRYTFSSAPGDDPNRFILNFSPVGIAESPGPGTPVNIYAAFGRIVVQSPDGQPLTGKVFIYNMVGQLMMERALEGGSLESCELRSCTGYYVVRVVNDKNVVTKKVFIP